MTHNIPRPAFTVEQMLADPCVSFWLKDRLRELSQRDCLDMAHDCEILLRHAFARMDDAFAAGKEV